MSKLAFQNSSCWLYFLRCINILVPAPICLFWRMSCTNNLDFFTVFASSSTFREGCLWTVWCSFHCPYRVALRIHSHHRWCLQEFSTEDTGALPCWSFRSCCRSSLVGSQGNILTLDCHVGDITYEVYKQLLQDKCPLSLSVGCSNIWCWRSFCNDDDFIHCSCRGLFAYTDWKWKENCITILYFLSIYL